MIEKYKPKNLKEIVGQEEAIRIINIWLKNWKQGKALLLFGPTGIGKTVIVETLAHDNKLDLIEFNASHDYSELEQISMSIKQAPLFSKGKIFLIDEADNIRDCKTLIKIIEKSKFPVILTANDAYCLKLKNIRILCKILKVNKISNLDIEKKLREICEIENIKIENSVLKEIIRNSDGDIRSAITDLEIVSHGLKAHKRKKEINIFNALKTIFRSKDIKTALEAIESCDKDTKKIFWWIEQNIYNEYSDPNDIAKALDILSKADMYKHGKRINEILASICLVNNTNTRFVSYRPPDHPRLLAITRTRRFETFQVCSDLAKYLHCSKRNVRNQLPYLNIIQNYG